MQRSERRAEAREEAALRLVQEHAADLLRFARRFSHCADDAHDAYQRALETLVRRLRSDPPSQPLAWIRTVLRREALALRAERDELVGGAEADFERHASRDAEDPAERVLDHERLRHAAEALQRLKPQELTALTLRAEGLSYREICARTGWTYTKTNRAITEGRRALRDRLGAIESGAECERWQPLLSALADGEASAAHLAQLRPHLRACPACRATLRAFHDAPAQVAALVPAALVPLAASRPGSALGHVPGVLHGLVERALLSATRLQGALEATSGAKLAAVAASTAALASGGAVLQHAAATSHAPTPAPLAARAAAAAAAPASLTTIAATLPGAGARRAAGRHGRGRKATHGEFTPPAPGRGEFAGGAEPRGEFAATAASSPAAVAQASSTTPSAPSGSTAGASAAGADAAAAAPTAGGAPGLPAPHGPPEFYAGP